MGLVAEGISYSYGRIRALDNVAFQAESGDFVALLGPNGSGKSTLLKILAGILDAPSARIIAEGKRIHFYGKRERARIIAYLPQTITIDFPFSVAEFVKMGRAPYLSFFGTAHASDSEAVGRALEKTGSGPLSSRPVTALSGGERQRVLLSQTLAQEARIFILDEPVSHLDIGHQLHVLQVLKREAADGKTVIASFHELNLAAQFADRILILSGGREAACGKPAEVLTPGVLGRVYGVKAAVLKDPVAGTPMLAFDL